MNANELMIGDWIQIADEVYNSMRGQYHQIDWIRTGELGLDNRKIITPPYAEPIPLTPEILEKNGAKHSVYEHPYFDYEPTEEELNDALQYYPFHSYKLGTNIEVSFYPKEIRVEVFGQDFVDVFKIRGRKGNVYVHELQHALRLCKIEKEIEL